MDDTKLFDEKIYAYDLIDNPDYILLKIRLLRDGYRWEHMTSHGGLIKYVRGATEETITGVIVKTMLIYG